VLLCAPTGAGKTNVALLTILHALDSWRLPDGSFDYDNVKIVYVAPMKALVQEMVGNFSIRLKPFGVNVNNSGSFFFFTWLKCFFLFCK